ncbi:ATPase, AFG1 family protein [Babesia caballi]|uniref:ATPase, AFG1 family protein n=1 Tax=Babesia caballi TaxID=5871 RepID=A0AAV4LPA3_BABCB|nr:ATPase, AFG1 family protein [Babesia caballi]
MKQKKSPSVETDDKSEDEYEVEDILDFRMFKKQPKYLVKWKGFTDSDNTWEPEANLTNLPAFASKMKTLKQARIAATNKSQTPSTSSSTGRSEASSKSAPRPAATEENQQPAKKHKKAPESAVASSPSRAPAPAPGSSPERADTPASPAEHKVPSPEPAQNGHGTGLVQAPAELAEEPLKEVVQVAAEPEEAVEVEDLLDYKPRFKKDYFLVRWKGDWEDSWEPRHNLLIVGDLMNRMIDLKMSYLRIYGPSDMEEDVFVTVQSIRISGSATLSAVVVEMTRSLIVNVSGARKHELRDCVEKVKQGVALARQQSAIDTRPEPRGWLASFTRASPAPAVRGMYIYGGVGQGKTMLMDTFYDKVSSQKLRLHFHDFMIRVQREMHAQKGASSGDVMEVVARRVLGDARVLCLDEFFVNHISDAMVLKPLFENLFKMGVVVVCTSNRPPEDLYVGGLNRDRFLPFIPLLKSRCDLFNLQARDFRQEHNFSVSQEPVERAYFFDPSDDEQALLSEFRRRNYQKGIEENVTVKVSNLRSVTVPMASGPEAYFRFSNLCGSQPSSGDTGDISKVSLGTEAFIALAGRFHTFWVAQVPQFDASNDMDGRLRSFMLFIDVLYERNTKLIMACKVPLLRLFGIVGIVKVADEFQGKLSSRYASPEEFCAAYPAPLSNDEFLKMTADLGLAEGPSKLMFEAVLPPDERSVGAQRIWDICENHRRLLRGEAPSTPHLYRFDAKDESVLENEFICSRALSRLFHMSSGNYLLQHRARTESS